MPYMPKPLVQSKAGLSAAATANAKRLFRDSEALAKEGRAHSSIILGIFALEELGKALITQWSVKNAASKRNYPSHVEKQAATFGLLAAGEVLKDPDRARRYLDRGTLDMLKFGPYSTQFAWARGGFYDDLRMAVTYDDPNPKIPKELVDSVDTGLALELLEYFELALITSNQQAAMDLAAEIYANGLGRL